MSDVTVTEDGSTITVDVTESTVSVGEPGIVSASAVPFTPTGGIAATNVQSALAELDAEKQPLDANLSALAALTSAADTVPYFTGAGTAALAALTAFGRSLIAGADAAAVRTTLGLGSLALASSVTASQISDSTAAGRTLLTAADAAAQRTALGLTGLATSGITGTLTLSKAGSTARTATFPDAAITVAGSAAALTSGRVPYVTTGGLLTDSANLLFTGTLFTYGDGTGSPSFVINGAAGSVKNIRLSSGGSRRWEFGGNNVAEGGADAGTPWILAAYNDSGSLIDIPITILRASGGAITLARPVTCTGAVTAPNGTAAAPGIRLTSEAHGLYRNSATSMGIAVAGAASAIFVGPGASWSTAINLQHTDASLPAWITGHMADGFLVLGGPGSTGLSVGGQTRLYGHTHATKASYVEFTRGTTVSAYFDGSGNLTCNAALSATGLRATTGFHEGPINGGITFNAYYSAGWKYRSNGYASALTDNAASGVILQVAPTGLAGAAISWQAVFTGTPTTLGFASAIVSTFNNTTDATTTSDGSVRLSGGLSVAKSCVIGGTAGDFLNIANSTGELRVNGTKVVAARKTGWTAQTATAARTDLGASPTTAAIASFLRALYDDLAGHGLIGA